MTKVQKLFDKILALHIEIVAIQEKCEHPKDKLAKKHWGSQGNWCKNDDMYYTDFICHKCQKVWTEEGSK